MTGPRREDAATRRVALTVEFDGSDFKGWQRQPTGERTVQGALEAAFGALPGPHGTVHGAGRTDAGVHALAMVAHCDTASDIPDAKLRLALNAHLPRDVAVRGLSTVAPTFEAQYDCVYRRYLYRMRLARERPRGLALDRDRVLFSFRRLDVADMIRAAPAFEGTRDFSSLATQETRSRVRTVHLCRLRHAGDDLTLHVAADGFLRGMVRAIAGTLLWIGQGTLAAEDVAAILDAQDRTRAGHASKAHALYFVEAGYGAWDEAKSEARLAERCVERGSIAP